MTGENKAVMMGNVSANLEEIYSPFLSSRCARQWEKIGTARRGGVSIPLFSIYSKSSIGIGEIPDLKWLIDWCGEAGLSIIQLLPMNDVGFDFRPYDSQSSFALEPMYLSLEALAGIDTKIFQKEIDGLRKKFPAGKGRVNYAVKGEKLSLLWNIFEKNKKKLPDAFEEYCRRNRYWLEDYALYKVIKEIHNQAGWESWAIPFKTRNAATMQQVHLSHLDTIQFYKWLQWQLYEQFIRIKHYAERRGVLFLGDIPFLVSRDSVDVWAHQSYFKLELSSGAPPDLYFAKGQRWGMPPYNWTAISRHHYDYVVEKLKYAAHFYDCFRIDHFVGIFRLWSIRNSEPVESFGGNGFFDPADESEWEEHGRKILNAMIESSAMLPCAEDLGTIPRCSWTVLKDYGIPGIDVQRWSRDWDGTREFTPPAKYRVNSAVNISTHDMAPLLAWWEKEEMSDEDRQQFWKFLGLAGQPRKKADAAFVKRALEKAAEAASVFSIQLMQDLLALDPALLPGDPLDWRINTPGSTSDENWSVTLPFPAEKLNSLPINAALRQINKTAQRI